jgi:hypothetical protein
LDFRERAHDYGMVWLRASVMWSDLAALPVTPAGNGARNVRSGLRFRRPRKQSIRLAERVFGDASAPQRSDIAARQQRAGCDEASLGVAPPV